MCDGPGRARFAVTVYFRNEISLSADTCASPPPTFMPTMARMPRMQGFRPRSKLMARNKRHNPSSNRNQRPDRCLCRRRSSRSRGASFRQLPPLLPDRPRAAARQLLECLLLGRAVPQSDTAASEGTPRYNPICPIFSDLPMG